MRPPPAHGAALPAGWHRGARTARPRFRLPTLGGLSRRARLALLALAVLAMAVSGAAYMAETAQRPGPAAPAGASRGTVFLGTATCADWRRAGDPMRLATIQALGIAATQPDPENTGATLSEGDAYGLFQRSCAPGAPPSTLLYETYNRAASFRSIRP